MKKSTKVTIIAGISLLVLIALMVAAYMAWGPQGKEGAKTVTVQVVQADGSTEEWTLQTDAEFLGEALREEGLIEGEEGPYGMYITAVNGVTANEGNQEWWCITKGGEEVYTGVDETPVADGDTFELTLMVGW
jgi:hypothetical protein